MLLEYMEDLDDKLCKEYSHGKKFNSFINEFDRATDKDEKEKMVKELKEINNLVNHFAQWEDNFGECKNKLFDIINAVNFSCMNTLKNERVVFNWRKQSKIINPFV